MPGKTLPFCPLPYRARKGATLYVPGPGRCRACGARRFAVSASRSHEQRHFQLLGTLSPGLQVWSFITHRLPSGLMRTLHCLLGASLFECPKVEKSSATCVLCGGFRLCAPYCVRGMGCGKPGVGAQTGSGMLSKLQTSDGSDACAKDSITRSTLSCRQGRSRSGSNNSAASSTSNSAASSLTTTTPRAFFPASSPRRSFACSRASRRTLRSSSPSMRTISRRTRRAETLASPTMRTSCA